MTDLGFQEQSLGQVSRTFALTIPQLPFPLAKIVGNAYLWCRVADTVEDESVATEEEKLRLLNDLEPVIAGTLSCEEWAQRANSIMRETAPPAEKRLIEDLARVKRVSSTFSDPERQVIQRCVRQMCFGMNEFSGFRQQIGLRNLDALNRYCYCVAGVVGELLTDLFCLHAPELEQRRGVLENNAVSFGLGLQITNILKDVWEDYAQTRCWLPRDLFARHGYDLDALDRHANRGAFNSAVSELLAIAHGHLRNAMEYTLAIPPSQTGMRRFCWCAILFAALTLKEIYKHPGYTNGSQVKITKSRVFIVLLSARLLAAQDGALARVFDRVTGNLPLRHIDATLFSRSTLSV